MVDESTARYDRVLGAVLASSGCQSPCGLSWGGRWLVVLQLLAVLVLSRHRLLEQQSLHMLTGLVVQQRRRVIRHLLNTGHGLVQSRVL